MLKVELSDVESGCDFLFYTFHAVLNVLNAWVKVQNLMLKVDVIFSFTLFMLF